MKVYLKILIRNISCNSKKKMNWTDRCISVTVSSINDI